ncbi:PD-(D/E)XK nuclease family protein [Candidatus Woesearchaeota archaeon]|nr:PD-(D/E)XK nuclease family protein [Candidatus Woesearchaeota archaeon]
MKTDNPKSITCPYCQSSNTKKEGKRKNRLQIIQKYKCKGCSKAFTSSPLKSKSYPIKAILNSILHYNLGYTQKGVSRIIARKHKLQVPQKTISNWINEYKQICTFANIRKQAIKLHNPKNIIKKLELNHIQPYIFKYHKAKLHLLFHSILYNNQFHNIAHFYEPLKSYIEKISTKDFPHHIFTYDKAKAGGPDADVAKFNNESIIKSNKNLATSVGDSTNKRASQIKFSHLKIKISSKNNLACKLARLALNLALTNKERHQVIQNFFLINDSTTIAVEVPVYLTNWDAGYYRNQKGFIFPLNHYTTPITGHIDILQIRNGLIHILDYKPYAKNENPAEQLTIYALALSRKLNLPLYYFKCAWFDENNYCEFFPLHAVYKKES